MTKLIYVVEDDRNLCLMMASLMKEEGFLTQEIYDGKEALEEIRRRPPDLLILDLLLPGMSGTEVCKQLRSDARTSYLPIIMVTGKGGDYDRIEGLAIGADDYLVKPFVPAELVARVKAILRRTEPRPAEPSILRAGDLELDIQRFEARCGKKSLSLTPTEFKILAILARHPGKVFNRQEILDRLHGDEKAILDRTIDVHIGTIREKIGACANLLKTVRGLGYKIEP